MSWMAEHNRRMLESRTGVDSLPQVIKAHYKDQTVIRVKVLAADKNFTSDRIVVTTDDGISDTWRQENGTWTAE